MEQWKRGDRVMWRYAVAPGQSQLIPAIVRKVTDKRVTVDILFQLRGETIRGVRSVVPHNLSARTQHFPELDD